MNYRQVTLRNSQLWEVYSGAGDVLAYTATKEGAMDLIAVLALGATQRMDFNSVPVKPGPDTGQGLANHKTWE